MRNIGLTRDEAREQFDIEWAKVRDYGAQMSEREAELAPRHHGHDAAWQKLERLKLDAIGRANGIRESGVIPWMKNDSLGSFDSNMETWAARVMLRSYHVDRKGDHDPVMVITSHTRQHRQYLLFDKEAAETLRDQLIYELERWDES